MRERYSRKFQTQFSRQKRKTQKKSQVSLSVFKYRTTSFLVLLLISLCLLVLFSFCVTTHSRNINKFRISVFFVLLFELLSVQPWPSFRSLGECSLLRSSFSLLIKSKPLDLLFFFLLMFVVFAVVEL